MSLGIMIKGSEGIVLAADSRVTLFNQLPPNPAMANQVVVIPANFDNATKLLRVLGQKDVGAVTYGLGAFITPDGPRTMHSFIPEFEEELKGAGVGRLSVGDFAQRLSEFFLNKWNTLVNRPANAGENINFLVGGYDDGAAYGRGFAFDIPNQPVPVEQNPGPGQFGITWGGQYDLVCRLLNGFDMELPGLVQSTLGLNATQAATVGKAMQERFAAGIPYQFLPLQDCVNLAIFLIRSTITFQTFRTTTVRGVGGHVEVATVTRGVGLHHISQKEITASVN